MTFADIIRQAIRNFVLNLLVQQVVDDIATNGLTPEDQAIVQQFLAQQVPTP